MPQPQLKGSSGNSYRLLQPLYSPRAGRSDTSLWKASAYHDENQQYIIKQPKHDDPAPDYPHFQHEASMQKLFYDSPFVRKMVDWIPAPAGAASTKPAMVLEAFERTLWDARWTRPLTLGEIKWSMKAVILGIWTIHSKNLVHTGESRNLGENIQRY